MSNSVIEKKSFEFSLIIIGLYKTMRLQKEFVLSKQLLRSGTSIGANVAEAQAAQSKRDFIAKVSISSKEARETMYWLKLIKYGGLVEIENIDDIIKEANEIIKILTSIVKTAQGRVE